MAEAAAQERRRTHLPEQPRKAFRARGAVRRQEGAELFSEIDEDRAGFENAHRLLLAAIEQRGDLRIRVDRHEARAELIALTDVDQPRIIFRSAMSGRQQLLEHDGDLLAVGRAERIKLERMLADRQLLVVRRPRDRPVDGGEAAAAFLVPGPDLRRRVFLVAHMGLHPCLRRMNAAYRPGRAFVARAAMRIWTGGHLHSRRLDAGAAAPI